jgi:DNA-binding transcriptional MerR regulator
MFQKSFTIDSNTVYCYSGKVNNTISVDELADQVNEWCREHRVFPANGQAGESITVRSVRYYRTLGLLDPPLGGANGFGEKHRLQLAAIRLLQAQGLPLSRIQQLLMGRSLEDLKRVETQGLAELEASPTTTLTRLNNEVWSVTPLNEQYLLVSRAGRGISQELCQRVKAVLDGEQEDSQPMRGMKGLRK